MLGRTIRAGRQGRCARWFACLIAAVPVLTAGSHPAVEAVKVPKSERAKERKSDYPWYFPQTDRAQTGKMKLLSRRIQVIRTRWIRAASSRLSGDTGFDSPLEVVAGAFSAFPAWGRWFVRHRRRIRAVGQSRDLETPPIDHSIQGPGSRLVCMNATR